jgi:hypothetical protein
MWLQRPTKRQLHSATLDAITEASEQHQATDVTDSKTVVAINIQNSEVNNV